MSQTGKFVTAIDIGTTKIVAIVGKKNKDGLIEVLGVGRAESHGVKRGVVLNIEETAIAIKQAVEAAQEMSGIIFRDVFVGIAGQHIKSIRNRGYKHIETTEAEITQKDVDKLQEDMYKIPIQAGEEIIHVIPQNYVVDNETGVKQPVGMSGRRLEGNFHIVIGQTTSAKNIKKCAQRAGLNVVSLILEPLASADAVLTADEKEAGVALVDIGGGTTDIAVFHDGIIRHTAVIPFGGHIVTSDIKEGCSILARHAEQLKTKFGFALSDLAPEDKFVTIPGISGREPKEISIKTLAYIIEARMEEIIDAIHYEIENSEYAEKLGAGIVITGGGAMLRDSCKLVKLKTGLDVRIGTPKVSAVKENKELVKAIYATGVGLIIKGFDYLDSNPDAITKQTDDTEEMHETDTEEAQMEETEKNKNGFLKQLKNSFIEIFDEKDSQI